VGEQAYEEAESSGEVSFGFGRDLMGGSEGQATVRKMPIEGREAKR
jgi:hypothetical protein